MDHVLYYRRLRKTQDRSHLQSSVSIWNCWVQDELQLHSSELINYSNREVKLLTYNYVAFLRGFPYVRHQQLVPRETVRMKEFSFPLQLSHHLRPFRLLFGLLF